MTQCLTTSQSCPMRPSAPVTCRKLLRMGQCQRIFWAEEIAAWGWDILWHIGEKYFVSHRTFCGVFKGCTKDGKMDGVSSFGRNKCGEIEG